MHITCVGVAIIYIYSASCNISNLIIYYYACVGHRCCLDATLLLWLLHHGNNAGLASQLIHIYVYVYTGIEIIHEQQQLACTPDPMNIYIQVGSSLVLECKTRGRHFTLLSEAIYHVSYAREPRNCLFIDVVMNLYFIYK